MKKITTSFLLSLLITLSFTSCSSDSSDNDTAAQDSTGDYWPTAIDNNWVYDQDGEETNMKIIGIDEMNGVKYYKFDQLLGTGGAIEGEATAWIKKNKGDYYIKIGDINIQYGEYTGKVSGYEFLLFKDYLEVNGTWGGTYTHTVKYNISDFPSITTNSNYTGKILERGISLTVNNKVYNSVIKFNFTQSVSISGAEPVAYSTDYWIAKDVGIIKLETGEVVSEIKSYTIK